MKNRYKRLLCLLLCLSLLMLAACSERTAPPRAESQSASTSADDGEPLDDPAEGDSEPEPDLPWYAGHYIEGISLQRMDDFESPEDIRPDAFVRFFMTANYDGAEKLPIPEGYRSPNSNALLLPAEDVEDYVTAFFDVSPDYLRTGDCYNAAEAVYRLEDFGITAQNVVEVTNVQENEDGLSLIFDVYMVMEDQEGESTTIGPISTRDACFAPNGDRFQVLSLSTLYLADMEQLMAGE